MKHIVVPLFKIISTFLNNHISSVTYLRKMLFVFRFKCIYSSYGLCRYTENSTIALRYTQRFIDLNVE